MPAARALVIPRLQVRGAFAACATLLMIAALVCSPRTAASPPPPLLTLTDSTTLPLRVERMDLLRDPSRGLELSQVGAADIEPGFAPAPAGTPNLGIGGDAVWARFALRNATARRLSLVLALAEPRMAHVAFWALDDKGRILAERRDGRLADSADRDRSHRWFLFDLPLAADSTATVYLRVTSDMGRRLDVRLTDPARLAAADRETYLWLGLYLGAMAFMFAYNLLLWVQLREAAHFWLACIGFGIILWVGDREGLLTSLAAPLWPDALSGIVIGNALGIAGLILFPVAYLRLAEYAPRWALVHRVVAAGAIGIGILYHFAPIAGYKLLLSIPWVPLCVVAGLLALKRERRAALLFLIAWAPIVLAAFPALFLTNWGLISLPISVWTLGYLALVLLTLLLSAAEADRINLLRRRAERAQAALRDNEQRLSDLVDARTRELGVQRDRAEAASRAKTQFLANMSHDLRTPLNAVLGGVELLGRSPRVGAEELGYCGLIQRGGRHLLRLIDDLLDIAEIEHGRLRPVIADCALRPMLDDLADLTRRQAEARRLSFRADLPDDLPARVRTDGGRVRQVLQNLLDNAVKYTDSGSVVLSVAQEVPATRASDTTAILVFSVTDTGRGISPADHERLFAPFEQYHPAQEGRGLGLAICRDLAAALGGELTLDSVLGLGSRFHFRLPVQRAAEPEPTHADDRAAPVVGYAGRTRRILTIDDSEMNRLLMAGLLGRLGFDTDTAASADEALALALARPRPPDLVITDLRMPEVCGYAAVWQLREALGQPRLPAIAASASPLPDPGDVAELGFDGFLLKPFAEDDLLTALGACLGVHWVRADSGSSAAVAADADPGDPQQVPLRPPRAELALALELATSRDWNALRDWCDEIEEGHPECAGFAARVRELLAAVHGPTPDTAIAMLHRLLVDAR